MGFFDLFCKKLFPKKKEIDLPIETLKFNKMFDLWADGKIESPYQDLMTYQTEVNNGGHSQFFFNLENSRSLEVVVRENMSILPDVHKINLEKAYSAYKEYADIDEDKLDDILDECDNVFYQYEEEINEILEKYSLRIVL